MIFSIHLLFEGISTIACLYLITLCLHIVLPGRYKEGYACADDNGNKPQRASLEVLKYKLNGVLATIISILLAAYLCAFILPSYNNNDESYDSNELLEYEIIKGAANFYERIEGCVIGGNLCGIIISIAFYLRGRSWIATAQENGLDVNKMEKSLRCVTKDQLGENSEGVKIDAAHINAKAGECPNVGVTAWLEKFYLGKGEFNPRSKILGCDVDWKMWLYLAGTVALEMHVLSMVTAHALLQNVNGGDGQPLFVISRAMAASAAMWTWFCFDYLTHEHVHLYTYDLFAERLGLKLIWGCCGVYPFLYPLALRCLIRRINETDDLSMQSTVAILALFVFGWILTRGANDQKFAFKMDPKKKGFSFCGLKAKQLSIEVGKRGEGRGPRKILVGGWWGLARHVNYMGEIVQGLAMSLPAFIVTNSPLSFVYFVFITALLVPRQKEDDVICRQKYGKEGWDEYTRLVPSKIVPFVY